VVQRDGSGRGGEEGAGVVAGVRGPEVRVAVQLPSLVQGRARWGAGQLGQGRGPAQVQGAVQVAVVVQVRVRQGSVGGERVSVR